MLMNRRGFITALLASAAQSPIKMLAQPRTLTLFDIARSRGGINVAAAAEAMASTNEIFDHLTWTKA